MCRFLCFAWLGPTGVWRLSGCLSGGCSQLTPTLWRLAEGLGFTRNEGQAGRCIVGDAKGREADCYAKCHSSLSLREAGIVIKSNKQQGRILLGRTSKQANLLSGALKRGGASHPDLQNNLKSQHGPVFWYHLEKSRAESHEINLKWELMTSPPRGRSSHRGGKFSSSGKDRQNDCRVSSLQWRTARKMETGR